MKDINQATITCNKCNKAAVKSLIKKEGFNLRSWKCPLCHDQWAHPLDLEEYNRFKRMTKKTYQVKLRLVGNSYAVSIPREIIDFQEEMLSEIDQIIKMSLETPEKLSLFFSKKMQKDLLI
jgi:transposase-like protein